MKIFKTIVFAILLACTCITYGQSEKETVEKKEAEEIKPKENSSQETVTKIIKIKGANGEEKVIKEEQIITKKSKLQLDPEDEDKTNQTAVYTTEEISIKNSDSSSDERKYTMIPDGTGYIMTFNDENGQKISKARLVSNGYYLVNNGNKDNCLGHFDENKNFILEMFDSKTDSIIKITYSEN
ncbi:hypothetical protein [Aquimarina sp. RZ0]|uniref:hypothetical protein n=1 Tax=Aquimarina sp. RZ0 TaxID=2607730 RepID=UPI0011F2AB78|nr:hypothetical protein [Aquimarina sp. RZ0]KAA1243704.1 hypothetical protein F0000_19940 [Aquimarina sp. RZ0]